MKQEEQIKTKTINILHIDSYNRYGGAQKSTINSLKAIKLVLKSSQPNSKYNFNFYAIHNNNKIYEEELNNLNIPNFSIKMKNFGDITAIIKISKFLIKYKINIVIFHSSRDHMLGGIACFLSGRKIIKILTRHVAYNISFLKGFLIYHLLTDHYIAISKYIKNILIDNLKINPDKITVIYDIRFADVDDITDTAGTAGTHADKDTNKSNTATINNIANKDTDKADITDINANKDTDKADEIKNQVKKELNIPEEMKIVSIIGRLSNEKGHITFLNAAKFIIEKRKDIIFMIIGDGDLFANIKEFITDNKLSDYIIMLGFKKNVEQYIKASDLIIVPSGLEGLGGIIVESCMRKKAVIASNVGGIPEIIDDGLTGILFEKNNFHELADKILNVIDDKKMLNELGNNCCKKITEEFNPYRLAEENINLYLRLLRFESLKSI
jgi:glycosyltransferase involved in cell wall biosynthesis